MLPLDLIKLLRDISNNQTHNAREITVTIELTSLES